jgi:predicted PurR-regulated permease PerM
VLQVLEAGCILLLLAMFFAYVVAPAIDAVSLRVRLGRRRRPLSRPAAILLVYVALFACGALAWHFTAPIVERWVRVTAPAVIDRVFTGGNRPAAVDRLYLRAPLPGRVKQVAARATTKFLAYVEGEVRAALDDVVAAARYVRWLAVPPVVAFLLLAYAPGFRRSALRVLPHGHLQWRGEEYLRDVNSALAGYVRAQLAAGVIVGVICTAVFSLFHLPYAVSMGIVAGVLELVPVIGPLTVVLMAAGQADHYALAVVLVLAALRLVQDLVVYPRLIRHGMHLSSAAVILAVWCGAALNGAAGVILAIPFAGFLSVSVRHWREYHAIEELVRTSARGS